MHRSFRILALTISAATLALGQQAARPAGTPQAGNTPNVHADSHVFKKGDVEILTFETEQDFYAQVADGVRYPVPGQQRDLLLNATNLRTAVHMRQYRRLLRLPNLIWVIADDLNWSESWIQSSPIAWRWRRAVLARENADSRHRPGTSRSRARRTL